MRVGQSGKVLAARLLIACLALLPPAAARAETALVAVAANFIGALKEVAVSFEAETGHKLKISSGSTGQLYAQIKHGAPFDVFLSADEESPRKLVEEKIAVAGSRFPYAIGQLAIWCPALKSGQHDDVWAELKTISSVAIANPQLAPYGRAARQSLEKHRLWDTIAARIVYGQNIAQTFALVGTGNAPCGFVARSQLMSAGESKQGVIVPVDTNDHDPIRQDAVLLKRAANNTAAVAFMAYLKTPSARKVIAGFGYLDGEP